MNILLFILQVAILTLCGVMLIYLFIDFIKSEKRDKEINEKIKKQLDLEIERLVQEINKTELDLQLTENKVKENKKNSRIKKEAK